MSEARQLAETRMREVVVMPLTSLVRFVEEQVETEITGPSGKAYRSKTYSFWDTEPYDSDLFTRVKVAGRGLRGYQRYYGVDVRGPDTEFATGSEGEVDVSPAWTEIFAWAIFALVIATFLLPWFIGVGYLISRVV